MEINFNTTNNSEWLDNKQYRPYAAALIKSEMKGSTMPDAGINRLRDKIDAHRNGETTAKGYIVNTKNLLGAMSSISKELVDAIMSTHKPVEKSLDEF